MELQQIISSIINDINSLSSKQLQLETSVLSLPWQDNLLNVELATKLWNVAGQLVINDHSNLFIVAEVRHQICFIVLKSGNKNLAITMALKTSLSWARAGDLSHGYGILKEVEKYIRPHHFLDLLSTKAQLSCFEEDLKTAEGILHQISQQSQEKAAFTCWEIAINFYRKNDVKSTRFAVERAIKFGKDHIDKIKLSQMYRLLATCYLDTDLQPDTTPATTAAQLAVDLDQCPESLLLRLKCAVLGNNPDVITKQLEYISEELCEWLAEAVDMVVEYGNPATASGVLSKYPDVASCETRLLLLKSQLLPSNIDSIDNITSTVKRLLAEPNSDPKLAPKVKDLLWKTGVDVWKKSDYKLSGQLYQLCLEVADPGDKPKLHRNIATCWIATGDLEQAERTLDLIPEKDDRTIVLLYQIALQKGEEDKAIELIHRITDESLLQTSAMLAFKTNSQNVAKESLYKAVKCSSNPKFILVASRCLLRLSSDPDDVLALFQLLENLDRDTFTVADLAYLADTAWNSAIKAKPDYPKMISLLSHSVALITAMGSPLTPLYLTRLRNCYLLTTAAHLQRVQEGSTEPERDEQKHFDADVVKKAMECIGLFKNLGNENLDQTTSLMLLLYEMECAVRLGITESVQPLLCAVNEMGCTNSATLNKVVKICMLGNVPSALQTAIRLAIDRNLKDPEPVWKTISQLFMELTKHTNSFIQLFKLWSAYANKFPEDEAAWMVCEAWNRSVTRRGGDVTRRGGDVTRELCSLALEVTECLPTYRESYQKHMKHVLLDYCGDEQSI